MPARGDAALVAPSSASERLRDLSPRIHPRATRAVDIGENHPRSGPVVLAQAALVLTLLGLGRFHAATGHPAADLVYPACLLLTAVSVWALWSWRLATGSLFDPYALFLVTAILFNAGQALLEVLHLNEAGLLGGRFDPDLLVPTLILTATGLSAFHLGALLNVARVQARPAPSHPPAVTAEASPGPSPAADGVDDAALRLVGWTLLLVSALPAALLASDSIQVVLGSGYASLYQRPYAVGAEAGPRILAALVVPAAILILIGGRRSRAQVGLSAAVILLYVATQLFLGYRAHAVMPLVAYVWAFHRMVRPVPRLLLLGGGGVLLLVVFPLVRAARGLTGGDRLTPSTLWATYASADNPAVGIVSELGGSMATTAWTLGLVPTHRPFDQGLGYLYAALGVVPNVFGGVHPSVARGTASRWLVGEVDPAEAARGGGYGYSFIAEAYLNFGWTGSALALAAIGFLLSLVFYPAVRSLDPCVVALSACFLAFLSHYARGEALSVARPLVWYALLPIGLVLLLSRRRHAPGRFPGPAQPQAPPVARPATAGPPRRRLGTPCG